jgi:hypothetical protein
MNLIEMYEELRSSGYVVDQYQFDLEWLGRKPGYTAYIRSTSKEPSIGTLFKFYLRLLEADQRETRLGLRMGQLRRLAEEVIGSIRMRALKRDI